MFGTLKHPVHTKCVSRPRGLPPAKRENAKTPALNTWKRENANWTCKHENTKTANSVLVFWFSGFLVFWFSRFGACTFLARSRFLRSWETSDPVYFPTFGCPRHRCPWSFTGESHGRCHKSLRKVMEFLEFPEWLGTIGNRVSFFPEIGEWWICFKCLGTSRNKNNIPPKMVIEWWFTHGDSSNKKRPTNPRWMYHEKSTSYSIQLMFVLSVFCGHKL